MKRNRSADLSAQSNKKQNIGHASIYSIETQKSSSTIRVCQFAHTIVKVSCDDRYTLFVTKDGDLYGMGNPQISCIPGGPTPIKLEISNVSDACFGHQRAIAILYDGTLKGIGMNFGFLYGRSFEDLRVFTPMPTTGHNNEPVLFVSIAFSYIVAITRTSMFVFGSTVFDDSALLSRGRSTRYNIDHIIEGNTQIVDVRSGSFHTAILNSAGQVFTGGNYYNGRLCRDQKQRVYGLQRVKTSYIYTSVSCTSEYTILGTKTGEVLWYGPNGGLERFDEPISSICSLYSDTAVITRSGKIYVRRIFGTSEVCLKDGRDYSDMGLTRQYLIPVTKRSIIDEHFTLMREVRSAKQLQDIMILVYVTHSEHSIGSI